MARPNLSYLKNLLLFLLGLPLGLLTGLTGMAASVFAVPAVRSLLGLHPARAVGTALAVTFFAALASILSYAQHGFLRGWLALMLLVGLSVGKALGRRLAPASRLHWLWGTVLAAGGVVMTGQGLGFFGSPHSLHFFPADHDFRFYGAALVLAVGIGLVSRVMGLGAELVVPTAIYGLGLAPHPAIATAIVVLALASLPGILVLARHHQVETQSATWLSAGGVLGGLSGALWAVSLPGPALIVLYGLLLMALGVLRLWQREETLPGDGTHPGTSADPGDGTHPGTSADPPETGG